MGNPAKIDADEVEKFAKKLKEFNHLLKQSSSQIKGQFSNLGSTWQDSQHQKFANEFQQTMKVINQFLKTSENHIPFLLKKVREIRTYLGKS